MLEYALAYARMGWPVFPLHTIRDGVCSCSQKASCTRAGKHPRVSNGRNGATLDERTIENWWSIWPDANIGIATGTESGLLVLDVDDGGEDALVGLALPDTVEQVTGSGGRHLLFNRPSGDHYKTMTRIIPGCDSRADGGYIVAPPSRHLSGNLYQWEGSSDPFEGAAVADAPEWFTKLIKQQERASGGLGVAPVWNPDGYLPQNAVEMLEYIPSSDYSTWRDVGMAINYADPGPDGYQLWDWWSSTAANYDPDSVATEWRNFCRRGHKVANPITFDSVRAMATAKGWIDADIDAGRAIAELFLAKSRQQEEAESVTVNKSVDLSPPDNLLPPEGNLIGDIARWIDRTAIKSQPRLAVAAALALVGTLAGRHFESRSGLRANLYLVGLVPTGGGKDHILKCISRLINLSGLEQYMGGSRVTSGAAIVNGLSQQPVKLYMLDEFGLMLQGCTGKNAASHQRDIISKLLELYSKSGSTYYGTDSADIITKPRQVIHNPHLCVYGTSTHATFFAAMNSGFATDGTLNRLVTFDGGDVMPDMRLHDAIGEAPPECVIARLRALAGGTGAGGNLSGISVGAIDTSVAETLQQFPEFNDVIVEFNNVFLRCLMDRVGGVAKEIYIRTSENAIKMAMTYAIGRNVKYPCIDHESWAWGRDVALWCSNTLVKHITDHVADNEQEGNVKFVLSLVRAAGRDGISRGELVKKTKKLRARDLSEIINSLLDGGEISVSVVESGKRPRTVYTVPVD